MHCEIIYYPKYAFYYLLLDKPTLLDKKVIS